ncbi:hypothetical protein D3C80_1387510 [compost metagenome]
MLRAVNFGEEQHGNGGAERHPDRAEDDRQRTGQRHIPEFLHGACSDAGQHIICSLGNCLDPVTHRDDDLEQQNQHNHQHFGRFPKPEEQHHHRQQGDLRNRICQIDDRIEQFVPERRAPH